MYRLGKKSKEELKDVNPSLVAVVERAIEITEQDFTVIDGIRTSAEQQALVDSGASQTLNSRHLDGCAVDLAPYIAGRVRFEKEPMFKVAEAMQKAAKELYVRLRWGGAWHADFTLADASPRALLNAYAADRRRSGKRIFIDMWHFELLD